MKHLCATLLLSSTLLIAQDTNDDKQKNNLALSLGAAGLYKESIYKGKNARVGAFPLIDMKYKQFYIKGIEAGYNIKLFNNIYITPLVTYRFDGFSTKSDNLLKGMDSRKDAVYGGARLAYKSGGHTIFNYYLYDISGVNNGFIENIGYNYLYVSKPFIISPAMTYAYKSENYANYYYGVKDREKTPFRDSYKVGSIHSLSFSVLATYNITPKLYTFATLGYEIIDGKIKKSPIIDKNEQFTSFFGVGYKIY